MILPHIPVSTGKHLPSLFNIYTRMLFWERERALSPRLRLDSNEQNDNSESSERGQEEKVPWEKLSYSFQSDDETLPELLHYFTFLYGLYPINFMSYIRKPSRYLRHANFPGADDIDVEPNEIRKRSEPFRELHLLHPNFFSLTIESELTDAHRWMNSAASDVVTFCMSLCVPVYHGSSSAPPMTRFSSLPNRDSNQDIPAQTLLTQTDSEEALIAQRHSHETPSSGGGPPELSALARLSLRTNPSVSSDVHMATNVTQDIRSDSPTIPNQRRMSPLHDILNSQQSLHRGLHQSLPNESSTTLSSVGGNTDSSANVDTYLQSLAQLPPRSPSLRPSLGDTTNMAFLRREIMLLRNDLNFERYLKQQHLSHIGQLRRMQVREATVEAETQNLINANKILKGKLEEAKNLTTQTKKESDKSRAQSKKWEQDLSAKLRAIKDEQKRWILEGDLLRRALQESQENGEELKQLVIKSEAREMESSRKLQAIKIELDDLAKLRSDVDRLTEHLREFQNQESEMEDVKAREDIANSKIELLNMQLKAREEELLKTKRANAAEIQDLKLHMKDVAQNAHSTATQNFKMMLDSALAASKLRLAEVHKAHTHLLRRYTSLQEDYLRLQEQHSTPGPLLGDSDEIESPESRSPTDTRNMPHRQPRRDSEDPQRLGHGGADNGSRQRSFSPDEQRKMSAATGSMMIPTRTGSSTHSDPRSLFNGGSLDNGAEAEMPKPKPQRRAYGRGKHHWLIFVG
jgi:solute carrier family 25 protein 16